MNFNNKYFYFCLFFLFARQVYCQSIFLGILDDIDNSKVLMDENVNLSQYGENFSSEYANKLIIKYSPVPSTNTSFPFAGGYYFFKYLDDFIPVTNTLIGDTFWVSGNKIVTQGTVFAYKVNDNMENPFNFMPVIKTFFPLSYDTSNYSNNIVVCTTNKNVSRISYKPSDNLIAFSLAKKMLKEFVSKTELKEQEYFLSEELTIYDGSFTIKDAKREYLVSYSKRLAFTNYASGVFVMDDQGNITKVIKEFLYNDFEYFKVLGTIDLENDGKLEILIKTGYHEGSGYELWGSRNNSFIKICEGLYFGV